MAIAGPYRAGFPNNPVVVMATPRGFLCPEIGG